MATPAERDLGPLLRIETEAIGEPGQRRFRLRLGNAELNVSLWLEKEQVRALATAIQQILAQNRSQDDDGGRVEAPPLQDFPLNPDLDISGPVPTDPAADGGAVPSAGGVVRWWWGPWYDHTNLRDERAEAFASYLPAGVYTFSYVARATTPGRFVVPPPRAEEMYAPETFGRGASATMVVE